MSNFVPESDDLRKALMFCVHLKKNTTESHRMLVEAYGDHAPSGFNGSEVMILMWDMKNVEDHQKSLKTPNCILDEDDI